MNLIYTKKDVTAVGTGRGKETIFPIQENIEKLY